MEGVLLRFGLYLLVACDQGNGNIGLFKKMCDKLNITCHAVAKQNHKASGVERLC